MICSVCKRETPCEHNGRKGARYYFIGKDGKLKPSSWDGLYDASEISVQPAGGFTTAPLIKEMKEMKRPMKTASDWMREFLPALDAAMGCPDVSPHETVKLYFEKIIEHERAEAAKAMATRFEKKPRVAE